MKSSFVFNIKKFFSSIKNTRRSSKILGALAMLILAVVIITPTINKSYAATTYYLLVRYNVNGGSIPANLQ